MRLVVNRTIPINPVSLTNGDFDKEIEGVTQEVISSYPKESQAQIFNVSSTPIIIGPATYLSITIIVETKDTKVLMEHATTD